MAASLVRLAEPYSSLCSSLGAPQDKASAQETGAVDRFCKRRTLRKPCSQPPWSFAGCAGSRRKGKTLTATVFRCQTKLHNFLTL
jgi:hypothetical protein